MVEIVFFDALTDAVAAGMRRGEGSTVYFFLKLL
jgi:hypothetical protein